MLTFPTPLLLTLPAAERDFLDTHFLYWRVVEKGQSEKHREKKKQKSTTPPGIAPQKARATIKPLHSVPAAWNLRKGILLVI